MLIGNKKIFMKIIGILLKPNKYECTIDQELVEAAA